jgi:hypothetical protein
VVIVGAGAGAGANADEAAGVAAPPVGAHLVAGDARAEDVLRRAGAARARDVMAITSDSAFNAEVSLVVRALAARTGAPIACHAEIADRQLCAAMIATARGQPEGARLHFFSRHDRAARDLVERSSLIGTDPATAAAVVMGGGLLAQAVVSEIARLWDQRSRRGAPALPVLVLDPGDDLEHQLALAPLPSGALDLRVQHLDPADVTGTDQLGLARRGDVVPASHLFVCLTDDAAALHVGLITAGLLPAAEVVVAVTSGTVFDELLPGDRGLMLHNVTRTVYASRSVRRDQIEEMARAAHSAYVAAALARGETPADNPSMVPWDELGEDLQRANLAQAAHIETKLTAIGCAVTPTPTAARFRFTHDEIEQLAEVEHERWADERRGQGWVYGAVRDNDAKVHPDLVDWSELGPTSQDKDRDAVREIPEQLRSAGLGIARTT